MASAFTPVLAATSGYIDVFVDKSAPICNSSTLVVESTWSFTNADVDGKDLVGIVVYDGSGSTLATDWQGVAPGENFLRLTAFGGKYSQIEINSRPITIDLYDLRQLPFGEQGSLTLTNSIFSQSPPLLERMTYDPAEDIPSCSTVPLAANLRADDEVLRIRRLAVGIPIMLLVVMLWPMRQQRRNEDQDY